MKNKGGLIYLASAAAVAIVALLYLLVGILPLPGLPPYEELPQAEGIYQALQREEGGEFRLYLRRADGLTEWYTIFAATGFSGEDFVKVAAVGDWVRLRHLENEARSVAELSVEGLRLLDYQRSDAAGKTHNRNLLLWGLSVGVCVAALCAAVALLIRRHNRRNAAQVVRAMEAVLQERDKRLGAAPERYDARERRALEDYIKDAFGPIAQIFHDTAREGSRVDIAVVEPAEEGEFYKLVTLGMGARRMDVPKELAERNCAFAELCIFLPPDWEIMGRDPRNTWPFRWLKTIARLPWEDCNWLGVGHSVHTGPLGGEGELTELLLAWGAVREGSSPRLLLPGGKLINVYQLTPLFPEELLYYKERGFTHLWERLLSRGIGPVVDMERSCCYDPDNDLPVELLPFLWTKEEKACSLELYTGEFLQERFERAGRSGSGHDWEALSRALLANCLPQLQSKVHFDSEDGMFYAYTAQEEALRTFAFALRELCDHEEKFDWFLDRMPEE